MCTSLVPLLSAIASIARCDSEPLPIEPKLNLPGSRLSSATSSAVVRAGHVGVDREHARLVGQPRDQRKIGERIVRHLREQQRVEPERPENADPDRRAVGRRLRNHVGSEIAAGARPVARSRTTVSVFACSRSPIKRMMMSGVEPAANGTTIRTGLAGHSCARGGEHARQRPPATRRQGLHLQAAPAINAHLIRRTIHARVKPAMTGKTPSASVAAPWMSLVPLAPVRSCRPIPPADAAGARRRR